MAKPKQDGGAAFPGFGPWCIDGKPIAQVPGMTLRDWFAGQALNGRLSRLGWAEETLLAKWSYRQADAMIAAREEAK